MNDNPLPVLGSVLAPPKPLHPELDISAMEKRPKEEQKMISLRLAAALDKLYFTAHDRGNGEEAGVAAAQALAMTMLNNFEEIIWALRVAGGARKP